MATNPEKPYVNVDVDVLGPYVFIHQGSKVAIVVAPEDALDLASELVAASERITEGHDPSRPEHEAATAESEVPGVPEAAPDAPAVSAAGPSGETVEEPEVTR